jgi:hypothetical protein
MSVKVAADLAVSRPDMVPRAEHCRCNSAQASVRSALRLQFQARHNEPQYGGAPRHDECIDQTRT